jgi:hypothetical protein
MQFWQKGLLEGWTLFNYFHKTLIINNKNNHCVNSLPNQATIPNQINPLIKKKKKPIQPIFLSQTLNLLD